MHEAKTNLSKIVNEVNEGETVYLAKAGKVVAEIKPFKEKKKRIFQFGLFKDQIWLAHDWDSQEVNQDIANSFSQEDIEEPNSSEEVEGEIHPKDRDLDI